MPHPNALFSLVCYENAMEPLAPSNVLEVTEVSENLTWLSKHFAEETEFIESYAELFQVMFESLVDVMFSLPGYLFSRRLT